MSVIVCWCGLLLVVCGVLSSVCCLIIVGGGLSCWFVVVVSSWLWCVDRRCCLACVVSFPMCPFVVVIRRCCLLVRVVCWLLLMHVVLRCCYVRLFVIDRRACLLCVVDAVDLRRC